MTMANSPWVRDASAAEKDGTAWSRLEREMVMDNIDALFDALRQAADPEAAEALHGLVRDGRDEELGCINALAFASGNGLNQEVAIAAMLHAAQLGILEMSWNILCPSCCGVLDANATLHSVRQENYHCAFCTLDAEPVLDDTVEVTFGVSARV